VCVCDFRLTFLKPTTVTLVNLYRLRIVSLMITIELRLSTLSIVAFGCGLLPLVPAILAAILSFVHYNLDSELNLKIGSGVLAILCALGSVLYIVTAVNPHFYHAIALNVILQIFTVAAGATWCSLRMAFKASSDVSDLQLRLEITCLITWVLLVLIGAVVLSSTITEVYLLNKSREQEYGNEAEEQCTPKIGEKPSLAFSASTLSAQMTGGDLKETEVIPTVDIRYFGTQHEDNGLTPSTVGSATFADSNPSPFPPTSPLPTVADETKDNNVHDHINYSEKHVKRHRSSMSLLSFLSQTQVHTKKPSISFKSKPNELIQRIKREHRHHQSLGTLGLSEIPRGISSHQQSPMNATTPLTAHPNTSNRSLGFDSWEVNSVAARDRYFWTMSNIESRAQSRNISDSSHQSRVSAATSSMYSRYQINSAGFAREERAGRTPIEAKSLDTRPLEADDQDLPDTPGPWQDSDVVEIPVEATMAQYDRERLVECQSSEK
jgi:hypothetical protein